MISKAKELIKKHEGFKSKVYVCPAGKLTVGYGRNVENKGISEEEAEYLLVNDVWECIFDLYEVFTQIRFNGFSKYRQAALVDMRYNLGPDGFRGFKKMLAAIESGDWDEAARQAVRSEWAKQVGYRAVTIERILREGM